jgi:hypothetical protein
MSDASLLPHCCACGFTSTEHGRPRTRVRVPAAATGTGSSGGPGGTSPSTRTGQSALAPSPHRGRCGTCRPLAPMPLPLGCGETVQVLPRQGTRPRRHHERQQAARRPLRRGAGLTGVTGVTAVAASARRPANGRARAPPMQTNVEGLAWGRVGAPVAQPRLQASASLCRVWCAACSSGSAEAAASSDGKVTCGPPKPQCLHRTSDIALTGRAARPLVGSRPGLSREQRRLPRVPQMPRVP